MYDDLLESQRPSKLEWFVLNTLIPSLFVTSLMHADVVWTTRKPIRPSGENASCVRMPLDFVTPFRIVSPDLLQLIAGSNSHDSP